MASSVVLRFLIRGPPRIGASSSSASVRTKRLKANWAAAAFEQQCASGGPDAPNQGEQMSEKQRYVVGTVANGPMFDQGRRWTVVGPGDTVVGYYATEEEAQQSADKLNESR